jgi:hypothetical protein
MIPNLEQVLMKKILALPFEKQLKVLAFIEQLEAEINTEKIENNEEIRNLNAEKNS